MGFQDFKWDHIACVALMVGQGPPATNFQPTQPVTSQTRTYVVSSGVPKTACMKDGSIYKGEMVDSNAQYIVLKIIGGTIVSVPWAAMSELKDGYQSCGTISPGTESAAGSS